MIYDKEYLLNRINQQQYERVDICEGHVPKLGHPVFLTLSGFDNVLAGVKGFTERSAGDFTVFLRATKTQHVRSAQMFHVRINPGQLDKYVYSQPVGSSNPDELRAQLEREITARMEMDRMRERVAQLEQENNDLRQPLNKAGEIFAGLISNISYGLQKGHAQPGAAAPMNGTQAENVKRLEMAFDTFVELFGAEGVVKLSERLKQDPNAVAFVRNYAGL